MKMAALPGSAEDTTSFELGPSGRGSLLIMQWSGSAVPVPSKQAVVLPRNSHESKGGRELYDSRQVKAISDEQTGIARLETGALRPSTARMVTTLPTLLSVQNSSGASNSKSPLALSHPSVLHLASV